MGIILRLCVGNTVFVCVKENPHTPITQCGHKSPLVMVWGKWCSCTLD